MLHIVLVSPEHWWPIFLRLCLAVFVGAVIGLERQLRHKPAGLRTHAMVSLGSALFVVIPLSLNNNPNYDAVSRVIQGITAGVGFLGAGEILRQPPEVPRMEVYGLTSAAAIWVSAALGVAAGCGLGAIALMGALLAFILLRVFHMIEHPLRK